MTRKNFILVTGGSSGIGSSIVKNLSRNYNVIVHGRDVDKINMVIMSCDNPQNHLAFITDLEEIDELEIRLTKFILENNIYISGFVHCAGYMSMIPAKMITIEKVQKFFSTNLFSASLIVKILLQHKLNSGSLSNIIFISSNISNFGAKAFSLYSASKAGLDGLMRSLSVELAPKIRVNSILPGAIHTPMTSNIFQDKEKIQFMFSSYPLGEGSPEDIANMVDFLISDKSKWISGQQFTVDGGRSINISV